VRWRDLKTADLVRAREAVATWRADHPQGTADEMVGAVGSAFRDEGWSVVLRGILFAVDRHNARNLTGIITEQAGAGR
jgi:hypothetical protein